jgi:UDP-N-acetyl-D-glucosamine dehydrogenase
MVETTAKDLISRLESRQTTVSVIGLGYAGLPLAVAFADAGLQRRFIQLAEEINFGMPEYVPSKINNPLNGRKKALNGSEVLILGVAYKADVEDHWESTALDLIQVLQNKGAAVKYNNPHVHSFHVEGLAMTSICLNEHSPREVGCVVITNEP